MRITHCTPSANTSNAQKDYSTEQIIAMARIATQVKICEHGSDIICVTSNANSFPIAMLRKGYTISHNDGVPCGKTCVAKVWKVDHELDQKGHLSLDHLAGWCGDTGAGALDCKANLFWACNNGGGLHIRTCNDASRCGITNRNTDDQRGVDVYINAAMLPRLEDRCFCVQDFLDSRHTEPASGTKTDGCFRPKQDETGKATRHNGQPVWTNGKVDYLYRNSDTGWDVCSTGSSSKGNGDTHCFGSHKRLGYAMPCSEGISPGCVADTL